MRGLRRRTHRVVQGKGGWRSVCCAGRGTDTAAASTASRWSRESADQTAGAVGNAGGRIASSSDFAAFTDSQRRDAEPSAKAGLYHAAGFFPAADHGLASAAAGRSAVAAIGGCGCGGSTFVRRVTSLTTFPAAEVSASACCAAEPISCAACCRAQTVTGRAAVTRRRPQAAGGKKTAAEIGRTAAAAPPRCGAQAL